MTVPNLIPAEGTVFNVRPTPQTSPYSLSWWQSSYITRVPETAVGWLIAQGWQVVSSYAEEDCGQTFYTMSRQSMMNWAILQTLLNTYTQAYNEGRSANVIRYENIVELWLETIEKTRNQLDIQGDISDEHMSLYVSQMDTLVADIESEIALAKADMTTYGDAVAAQLTAYLATLAQLEPLYDTHEATAEAFLTDLGVAELARINEQFDTALANNLQSLTNRGLYSSAIVTAITARIERERSEAITNLNDRLAREKLENEHTLFKQEMEVKGMVMDGRMKNASMQHQQGQFLVETRTKCALTIMQARLNRLQGRMDIRDKENALMAYQLDARNNLIVGLFAFMERREDDYPSLEQMTQLVAGLGDAGGGWVQP